MATSRTRATLLLTAIFVAGLVIGALVASRTDRSHGWRDRDSNCTVKQRRVCFWVDVLGLSAQQQDSLAPVYDRAEVTLDSIQGTIRPAIDSVFNSIRPAVVSQRTMVREQVRALLTSPQREKYDSIVQSWDRHRPRKSDSVSRRANGKGAGNAG